MVLVAELVSIVLTLATNPAPGTFLVELAETSLYVLWNVLLSALLLCRTRRMLERLGKTRAFVTTFVLLELLSLAVAESAWQVTHRTLLGSVIDDSHNGFLLRTFAISSIIVALAMRYLYVSSEWRRSIVLEAQSRISALQALIRPHFLFNSLNTIAALARSDPRLAEQAVEDLADLMRANLGGARDRSTLEEELEIATTYQRIEKLRLGERLQVRWDVDELPMHAMLPSLTIQPLLDNAIYHGIERLPNGGEVVVTGRLRDDRIEIGISNPVPDHAEGRREGNRMALSNISQRFELAYGHLGSVSAGDADGHYTVALVFPRDERLA
jgi:two-component system sensor histidine kinase AlgZ